MTTLREAAQQALEALRFYKVCYGTSPAEEATITALKAALAESPTWVCPDSAEHRYQKPGHCEDCGKTLVQVAESPDSTKLVAESEPVAWLDVAMNCAYTTAELDGEAINGLTPLYTAPLNLNDPAVQKRLAAQWGYVKAEPLTEYEILKLMNYRYVNQTIDDPDLAWIAESAKKEVIESARAIERAHGIGEQE